MHTQNATRYISVNSTQEARKTARFLRKLGYTHTRYTQAQRGRSAFSYYTRGAEVVAIVH